MKPKLLSFPELKSEKGIPFSRQHVHRLVSAGEFPPPIKLGAATNAWLENEIDAWLKARIEASLRGRRADPQLKAAVRENLWARTGPRAEL
jgi:prophage regulatory protein